MSKRNYTEELKQLIVEARAEAENFTRRANSVKTHSNKERNDAKTKYEKAKAAAATTFADYLEAELAK